MTINQIDRILSLTLDVSRFMRKSVSEADLKGPSMLQLHALVVIRELNGMTMKQFADVMRVSGPTATAFIERLCRLGWVRRTKDPGNRKLVRLRLTPDGSAIVARAMQARHRMMADVLSELSAKDRDDFVRILEHLVAVMQRHSTQ